MIVDQEHPAPAVLKDFLSGKLPSDRSEEISQHVGSCETCQQTVPTLDVAGDTLVSRIRATVPDDPYEQESACDAALQAIAAFGRDPTLPGRQAADKLDAPEIEQLREYKLLGRLGQGGMGTVYKALHMRLEKVVALKVLPAERIVDPGAVARFEREMKAVGKLTHPNIVAAHDAGEADGMHYLVMELVRGIDLSKLARRVDRIESADACEMIRQAAVGLQHAHRRGLVHRDIKPSNLMLAEMEDGPPLVKVLDLGLALLEGVQLAPERDLTTTGQLMGTLDYMAPEQGLDSHDVDIRADIYSLGATLYRLLAGEPPFSGPAYNSPMKMLRALSMQSPPSIGAKRTDLPPDLVAAVDRMLAKEPRDRFATPQEVAEALAPFCAGCDLGRLLEQVEVENPDDDLGTLDRTIPHLSSDSTETEPTAPALNKGADVDDDLPPFHQPLGKQADFTRAAESAPRVEVFSQPSRWHRRPAVWIAAALAGVLMLGAIVLTLRTPHGEVIVELGDGVRAEDVKIEVAGNGDLKVADAESGWSIDVREGKYNVQLAAGQDQFKLDKQEVVVTRGEKTRVRVTLHPADVEQAVGRTPRPSEQPAAGTAPATTGATVQESRPDGRGVRPTALADRERPFVVVSQSGQPREFQFLSEALSVYQDGDAIKVHANGPLGVGQVRLKDKSLVLRAASGYRPVLTPDDTALTRRPWFSIENGDLHIDGCDFRGTIPGSLFRGGGSRWTIQNSRFLLRFAGANNDNTGLLAHSTTSQLTVVDCLIQTRGGRAIHGESLVCLVGERAQVDFINNVVESELPLFIAKAKADEESPQQFTFRNNTILTSLFNLSVIHPLEVHADNNIFDSSGLFHYGKIRGAERQNLRWHGSRNLYVGKDPLKIVEWDDEKTVHTTDLASWRKFWNSAEEGSLQAPTAAYRWRFSWVLKDPAEIQQMLQAEMERLRDEHESLTDVGPDWSLIGPGEAYVRALEAEGRGVPQEKLRPLAPKGGPVVLMREGQEAAAFHTLQEAFDKAEDGDAIEIRSDASFKGCTIRGEPRELTLRAAPGYQPVIDGRLIIGGQGHALTFEGLEFRNAASIGELHHAAVGSVKRLANCSFAGHANGHNLQAILDAAGNQPAEIVNCLLPHNVVVALPAKESLAIRNSVVGPLALHTEPNQQNRLILDRSAVWSPGFQSGAKEHQGLTLGVGVSVEAHQSLFGAGPNTFGFSLLSPPANAGDIHESWSWKGDRNAYLLGESLWGYGMPTHDMPTWREHWNSDADSIQLDPLDYDPQWWRLLPGSPGQGAGEDGKNLGADVDRVATTAHVGRTPRPSEQPAAGTAPATTGAAVQESRTDGRGVRPTALADRERPFVLLRDGQAHREFTTWAGFLPELRDGDVVEIHAHGPFVLQSPSGSLRDPEPLASKAVTLRAGDGYRPVLRWSGHFTHGGKLRLEGLDLLGMYFQAGKNARKRAEWEVVNCRLAAVGVGTYGALHLEDSLVLSGNMHNDGELSITNCLVCCADTMWTEESRAVSLRAEGNTFLWGAGKGNSFINFRRSTPTAYEVSAHDNLFCLNRHTPIVWQPVREHLQWNGGGNWYAPSPIKEWRDNDNNLLEAQGLALWNQLLGKEEPQSQEIERPWFGFGQHLRFETAADFLQHVRQRIEPIYQGHGLTDAGPQWELVGPGDAYLRALAAAGAPVAEKDLLPEAVTGGPCVLLRQGKVVAGFADLVKACEAARDDDVIEIRTNKPQPDATIVGKRRVTIRAGAGYRPVLGYVHPWTDGSVSVEGVQLRTLHGISASSARYVNCEIFSGPANHGPSRPAVQLEKLPTNAEIEIVNCSLDGHIALALPQNGRLTIRNSVLANILLSCERETEAELVLDQCAFWTSEPNVGQLHAISVGHQQFKRLAIEARGTLFEAPMSLVPAQGVEWSGSQNIYRLGIPLWSWLPDGTMLESLSDWQAHWNSDANSVEDRPLVWDPQEWKLQPGSPGHAARPDGRDAGADVDRVATSPTNP